MSEEKALVKNSADQEQVKTAERKVRHRRKEELADFKDVLSAGSGRRVLWRILEQCKVFESIWSEGSRIHYQSGRQDLGHFILGEITQSDDEALFLMMREAKLRNDKGV